MRLPRAGRSPRPPRVPLRGAAALSAALLGAGAALGAAPASAQMPLTVSINATTSIAEGPRLPNAHAVFTVELSAPPPGKVTVDYATRDGTATGATTTMATSEEPGDIDFLRKAGTLEFATGTTMTSVNIRVQVFGDYQIEGNETFDVVLSNAVGAMIGNATGTATLRNDDSYTVEITSSDWTINESDGFDRGMPTPARLDRSFGVNMHTTTSEVVTVTYDVEMASDSATEGVDYEVVDRDGNAFDFSPGRLTIRHDVGGNSDGHNSTTVLTIRVIDDDEFEPNETVRVTLTGATTPSGKVFATSTRDTQLATIVSDDDPALSIRDAAVQEGDSGTTSLAFTVSLPVAASADVTVDYVVDAGSTATSMGTDADYVAPYSGANGSATITSGATSTTIPVTVNGDTMSEPDETVVLRLLPSSGAPIARGTGTGTIRNDDAPPVPMVSIGDAAADEGSGPLRFTVELSAPAPAEGVDFTYEVGTSTASAGSDYTAPPGTGTIAAGATTTAIDVALVDDAVYEAYETLVLRLVDVTSVVPGGGTPNAVAASGAGGEGTGTIRDDDEFVVTLAASGLSVAENATGSDPVLFEVTADRLPGDEEIMVDFAVEGFAAGGAEAATAVDDYDPAGDWDGSNGSNAQGFTGGAGTYKYLAKARATGSTTVFRFPVVDDVLVEGPETLRLTLSNARTANPGVRFVLPAASAVATITDDEAPAEVSVDPASVREGDAGDAGPAPRLPFRVVLDRAAAYGVAFDYAVVAGTGYSASPATGSGTIAAGATSTLIDVVEVVRNDVDDGDKTVRVALSNLRGPAAFAGGGATLEATGTIVDDDGLPELFLDPAMTPEVSEGDMGDTMALVFTVMLSEMVAVDVEVAYVVRGGGGNIADAARMGTVTIAAGQTSAMISIPVMGDDAGELAETVTVEISAPTAGGVAVVDPDRDTGTGTILNDDPVLTIAGMSVAEGDGGTTSTLAFAVMLEPAATATVTVDWRTTDAGDATPGMDFAVGSGTLMFAMGDTSRRIEVAVRGDDESEADEEVAVELYNVSGPADLLGGVSMLEARGTIVDDELPVVTIDMPSADEDAGTLVFTVELDQAWGSPVTAEWRTTDAGTATAGTDFTAGGGMLRIPPNTVSTAFSVPIRDDGVYELDETVAVELFNLNAQAEFAGGGSTLAGTGTIVDDDEPRLSIDSPSVREGAATMMSTSGFTVTLSPPALEEVTVEYAVATESTAAAGVDYTATAMGTLTFGVGSASQTIPVVVVGDDDYEDGRDETVVVELSSPSGAVIPAGTETGTLTILRDEPVVSVGPRVRRVGGGRIAVPVALDVQPSADVTFNWTASSTAAVASGMVTIPAGETSGTIEFGFPGGVVPEEFSIVLSSPTGGAVLRDGDGNPDPSLDRTEPATVRTGNVVAIDMPSADEDAGTLVFTVTLFPPLAQEVTAEWRTTDAGTAKAAEGDFAADSGTVTFASGATSTTFPVRIRDDGEYELAETVAVELFNLNDRNGQAVFEGGGSTLPGTGTIRANDQPRLSIDSPSVREGAAGAMPASGFTVTLSAPALEEVTVGYAVATGTAAAGGVDYTTTAMGTLRFAVGSASQRIAVAVTGDDVFEPDETVVVVLSSPSGALISEDTGTLTILRDEPVVSVGDRARRAGDGMIEVTVELDVIPSADVTINWTASNTAATTSGMVTIRAGETSGTIGFGFPGGVVPETFDIVLSNPTSGAVLRDAAGDPDPSLTRTAPATVRTGNPEAVAAALGNALAGIGRMIASNVVDLVWDRAEGHRSGAGDSYALVGGRRLGGGAFAPGGGAEDGAALRLAGALAGLLGLDGASPGSLLRDAERRLARGRGLGALRDWASLPGGRDLMGRTRFAVSFDDAEGGLAGRLTFWGRGSIAAFESDLDGGIGGGLESDGEAAAGHLGVDYRLEEELLVGVAVGHTAGDVDYAFREGGDEGGVETELTSLHPYLHWMSPSGLGVWGSVGYGTGSAEVKPDRDRAVETDLAMEMAAAGVQGDLAYVGNIDLAVKADAFLVGTKADAAGDIAAVDADASRLRLALEGSTERVLEDGAVLAGRIELGARLDDGDAGEGVGADLAAGFGYAFPRLGLEVKGRGSLLLAHEEGGFREWGLGLGLTYDPGAEGRGVELSLEPVWRIPARDAAQALWKADPGSLARPRGSSRGASLNARLGYGMGAWGDRALATVFGELGGTGSDRLRLGAGLRQPGGGLGLELYGERRDRPAGAEHSVVLKGSLGF